MPHVLGQLAGAAVATGLLSRLTLWLFRSMGEPEEPRILAAHAVAMSAVTLAAGYGLAHGGPPQIGPALIACGLPTLLWTALDLITLKRRQTKTAATGTQTAAQSRTPR